VTLPADRMDPAAWLAGLAASDRAILESASGSAADNIEESGLDVRTHALVRLAALVAAGEPAASYDHYVATALDHGVTPDEIVGVLVALAPTAGAARVAAAVPALQAAIDRVAPDLSPARRAEQP
jgi:4-carboxymuconolactone decarboxylase